jgi:hypothetical protein
MADVNRGGPVVARLLQATWRSENRARFASRLGPCVIEVVDMSPWGLWEPTSRTIRLSARLLGLGDWLAVREVLLHEMAHQYVTDVEGGDASPHGPVFRRVCEERGIDRRAMRALADVAPSPTVRRIQKLLQLAASPERHEAETALQNALRLLAREGLELDDLAGGTDVRVAAWGGPRVRWPAHLRVLAARLSKAYAVEALLVPSPCLRTGRTATTMEVMGPLHAVELFLHTADCVAACAERAWTSRRVSLGPSARRGFLLGVVEGFMTTLSSEIPALTSAGLVLRDGAAAAALRARRYPRLRRRSVTMRQDAAWRDGVAAGEAIRVRPAVTGAAGRDRLRLVDTSPGRH